MPRLCCRLEKISVAWKAPRFPQRSSFWAGDPCGSREETGALEESTHESAGSRKQHKNQRLAGLHRAGWTRALGLWLVLRPCLWTRWYPRHLTWRFCAPPPAARASGDWPCLRCVPRSLRHVCGPSVALIPRNSASSDFTPSTGKIPKCSLPVQRDGWEQIGTHARIQLQI